MTAGTSSQPSLSPTQTMRNKAKSMLSLTAPSQMKRKSSEFSTRTSYSSSSNSIGTAPPTPTSPTHPPFSESQSSLDAPKPKKIRPGGGRRHSVAPSKSQISVRTTPSLTTLPILKPVAGPPTSNAKDAKVPKLKIRTGGGRRHMAPPKPKPAPPKSTPVPAEPEVLDVRVHSPSPPSTIPSRPTSPAPSSSSSSHRTPHAIPTPSTPTRRIRIPPAPRIPPPPVPTISGPSLSPINLSPLQSPAHILQTLPPSPSSSPSPRRPFRALPSPPSPLRAPVQLSSSAPSPSAIRRLPSPPSSSLFSPLTPPSPLLLPLPASFAALPHELELLQSSSNSAFRNRRLSDASVDTLPPYSPENQPMVFHDSSSPHSSPTGYGSPRIVPVGHPIMRHGRNRYRRSSHSRTRMTRSPTTLPTQIEEPEDGVDQNEPSSHMKSASTASDLLFYQENVMVPLFSGPSTSRPTHSRRRSSSTPPFPVGPATGKIGPHQALSDDEDNILLRRRIRPLDTLKANREYKLPANTSEDDGDDSDVDPAVCESPGYQGDTERFGRQMARYQDRKARYDGGIQP